MGHEIVGRQRLLDHLQGEIIETVQHFHLIQAQRPFAVDVECFAGELLPHAAEHFQGPARPDLEFDPPKTGFEGGSNRGHEGRVRLHAIQARPNLNKPPLCF